MIGNQKAMDTDTGRDLPAWLAWQEANHPKTWDLGLARIGQVWQALGGGEIGEHSVIVAGTNGKGSCVRWCEALAVAHGVSVATFTSPHLSDYRERIRFDGVWVEEDALIRAFNAIEAARGKTTLTYFEWSALAAFYLMRERMPQLVILEVGLGGRLDATNLIDADAAIITRIGIDHQDWLGRDVETIAGEKAGVLRTGQIVALADAHPPTAILRRAAELGAVLWHQQRELQIHHQDDMLEICVPACSVVVPRPVFMPGAHQEGQLAASLAVFARWFPVSTAAVANVARQTAHPGRLMWYKRDGYPADWLFDVAHNADSAEVLATYLHTVKTRYRRVWCICGMLRDKAHDAVFTALDPVVDAWILCSLGGVRGFRAEQLAVIAHQIGVAASAISVCNTPEEALTRAEEETSIGDLVVVMGSFVTVAHILERIENDE